jgi:hypothetical protein
MAIDTLKPIHYNHLPPALAGGSVNRKANWALALNLKALTFRLIQKGISISVYTG